MARGAVMRTVALALIGRDSEEHRSSGDRMTYPAMANPRENLDAEQIEPAAGALTQARPRAWD